MESERTNKIKIMLIVEDSLLLLRSLRKVTEKILPSYEIDYARDYAEAELKIKRNCRDYSCILLDHRMPLSNEGDETNSEEIESFASCFRLDELERYRKQEGCGYGLIPLIRKTNPNTLIIGTSSKSPEELRKLPPPDARIGKLSDMIIEAELKEIFERRYKEK